MNLRETFGTDTPVVGMVHLRALPGSPKFDGDREDIFRRAREDARALDAGGVDGIMVENFGDAPFYPDDVPKHTVASLTRAVCEVRAETDRPVGVNVLRNDGPAAVSIAAATGAEFVRVNVHTGARVADQGVLEGKAHETMRLRENLGVADDVALFADHDVKHSAPLATEDFTAESFADGVERGLADAMVVSGIGTGHEIDASDLEGAVETRERFGLDTPIFVGSGVNAENVGRITDLADGVIVGTALKEGGETTNPVDADRVAELVDAAR